MIYKIDFNGDIFNVLLQDAPSIFDVVKCEKGEFMIVDIEEGDTVDTLKVVQHESVEL